jgi:hypothetical protein
VVSSIPLWSYLKVRFNAFVVSGTVSNQRWQSWPAGANRSRPPNIGAIFFGEAESDPDLRIDEQNYDDGSHQNDQPIGNLNARYGCFSVNPAHRILPVRLPRLWPRHTPTDFAPSSMRGGWGSALLRPDRFAGSVLESLGSILLCRSLRLQDGGTATTSLRSTDAVTP